MAMFHSKLLFTGGYGPYSMTSECRSHQLVRALHVDPRYITLIVDANKFIPQDLYLQKYKTWVQCWIYSFLVPLVDRYMYIYI